MAKMMAQALYEEMQANKSKKIVNEALTKMKAPDDSSKKLH